VKPLLPGTTPPWIIAHRGASHEYPENTIAAFDAALEEGCDGIELDVQLSRDGVPVVYHDRTLAKAGGGRRRVSQLDVAELTRLEGFRGATIPKLADVLERYGRRTHLLVELKVRERDRAAGTHRALAAAVAAELRRCHIVRDVLVLSFDEEALRVVRAEAPGARLVLNVRRARRWGATLRAQVSQVFALSVDIGGLSPAVARATHEAGKPVMVFTCNTRQTVGAALKAGVDVIMSDKPAWARRNVERRLARSGRTS
jgi:glycerophosphoryl diester phosphodiesterase